MSVEVWTSAVFHEQVRSWVGDQLGTRGIALTGQWDQPHARAWSSAIRFETTVGRTWFKVNGPGTRHEAALIELLNERVPGLVPEVLAADLGRGWSLSRDGGPMLRQALTADQSWGAWEGIVRRYAESQLLLARDRDAVLACGVLEVSPATAPDQARSLVAELAAVPVDGGGLAAEEVDRLEAVLPELAAWCAELASSGVPDSVQHDDLHSGNVCWGGSVDSARVIDWGDASWGSPLASMLTTMNSTAFHAGLYVEGRPVDAPAVLRVRDAYLEPFTAYAPRSELVHLVDLARRTGCVSKALSYRAALQDAPASAHAELGFPVRDWLIGLLDA